MAAAAFCALWPPRSALDAVEIDEEPRRAALRLQDASSRRHEAVCRAHGGARSATHLAPARSTRSAISAAIAVVDADDRRAAAGHQPLLDIGVVLHRCRGGRDDRASG